MLRLSWRAERHVCWGGWDLKPETGMEEGEKETRRDIDDPVSLHAESPRHPFHSTFGIPRCCASLYVHVPVCMHGRQDWAGGALKRLAEKGISCGEKEVAGGEEKGQAPSLPTESISPALPELSALNPGGIP